jgi:methyl-accepting chemotaxis protein
MRTEGEGFEVEKNKDTFLGEVISKSSSDILGKGAYTEKIKKGNKEYLLTVSYMNSVDGFYAQLVPINTILSSINQFTIILIITFSLAIVALFLIIIFLFSRVIFSPLKKLSEIIEEISEGKGDLTKRIPVRSKDEIGVISKNFNKFIESLNDMLVQINNSVNQIMMGSSQISESTQSLSAVHQSKQPLSRKLPQL